MTSVCGAVKIVQDTQYSCIQAPRTKYGERLNVRLTLHLVDCLFDFAGLFLVQTSASHRPIKLTIWENVELCLHVRPPHPQGQPERWVPVVFKRHPSGFYRRDHSSSGRVIRAYVRDRLH